MYVRVHNTPNGSIIAACDKNLIGKELSDGKATLDLKKYSSFYGQEIKTEKELETLLKRSFNSANLVGKKAVSTAIKAGIIEQNNVMYIKKIPYVQVYQI